MRAPAGHQSTPRVPAGRRLVVGTLHGILLLAAACGRPPASEPAGEQVSADGAPAATEAPDSEVFRITPLRPVAELRAEALAASPPPEDGPFRLGDLVELRSLDPSIRYDIRYATDRNFMGEPFYTSAHAFMQSAPAAALVRAHRTLAREGYGILVHDAYRPWHVTKMFWDATPPTLRDFVANPADGSRHNRGAAADVTLYDLATGEPVAMPSGYDEFTERAAADYPGGSEEERRHRALLRRAMEAQGFTVLPEEWWHFDHGDWRAYPILNLTFEELEADTITVGRPGLEAPRTYVEAEACPYECCVYREWTAHGPVPVYAAERDTTDVVFQLSDGESFQALTGNVHLDPTGQAVLREDVVEAYGRPDAWWRLAAGDTLAILSYQGEGFYSMWYRGVILSREICWGTGPDGSPGLCELLREPVPYWWVRARTASGEEGWIDMNGYANLIGNRDACG